MDRTETEHGVKRVSAIYFIINVEIAGYLYIQVIKRF